jgi:preprotein translocase subunit SecA
MRIFGSERIAAVMDKLGAEEGEVIEHSMVTKSIERAQKKVEGRNFEMRKHVLDYDDVMSQQRQVIYNRRHDVLARESAHEQINDMIDELVDAQLQAYANAEGHPEEWDWEGLQSEFSGTFFLGFTVSEDERETIDYEKLRQHLTDTVQEPTSAASIPSVSKSFAKSKRLSSCIPSIPAGRNIYTRSTSLKTA